MTKTKIATIALACAATLPFGLVRSASAQDTIYGIGAAGGNPTAVSLFSFSSANPGILSTLVPVTGVATGFNLESIDFRPATGELYGLAYNGTNTGQLYVLNLSTGLATARGGTFIIGSISGSFGNSVGIGFNPAVDAVRIVTGTNGNFRVNPTTGALTADTGLAYAGSDRNSLNTFQVSDGDYTTSAALYDIDYINKTLVQQTPPNSGLLYSAPNNLDVSPVNGARSVGFDISQSDIAFLTVASDADTGVQERLYGVNLATGRTTDMGLIGASANFNTLDIAVAVPEPGTWALLAGGLALLFVVQRRRYARRA